MKEYSNSSLSSSVYHIINCEYDNDWQEIIQIKLNRNVFVTEKCKECTQKDVSKLALTLETTDVTSCNMCKAHYSQRSPKVMFTKVTNELFKSGS